MHTPSTLSSPILNKKERCQVGARLPGRAARREHHRELLPRWGGAGGGGAVGAQPLVPSLITRLVAGPLALPQSIWSHNHPGGNPWANLKSISHRCHPILLAFVWELTKETTVLPLGCLQGGFRPEVDGFAPRTWGVNLRMVGHPE